MNSATDSTTDHLDAADLYAGGGGSALGLQRACAEIGLDYSLTVVNHDANSIETQRANHPKAKHLRTEVDRLRRNALSRSGSLGSLWASPACTDHSYAKGGASLDYASRMSAWAVVREAERYQPKIIIVENVEAFEQWGPVEGVVNEDGTPKMGKDGYQLLRPIKARRGETYRSWFAAMESVGRGYKGQRALLDAAGFGAPQRRVRSFTVFTAPGIDYEFPAYTHGPGLLPYTPASSVVELGKATKSIFEPVFGPQGDRYLSLGTLERIAAGVVKLCDQDYAQSFLVVLRRHADARGLNELLPTVLAGGTHFAVLEPRLIPLRESFVLGQQGGSTLRSVTEPMPTVATAGFLRVLDTFMVRVNRGLTKCEGPDARVSRLDGLLDTVTTKNGLAVTDLVVAKTDGAIDDFRIVERDGDFYYIDAFLRMLDIPELASAQGFPDDYVFIGGRGAQTAQVGNAVEVLTATALYRQALRALGYARERVAA